MLSINKIWLLAAEEDTIEAGRGPGIEKGAALRRLLAQASPKHELDREF